MATRSLAKYRRADMEVEDGCVTLALRCWDVRARAAGRSQTPQVIDLVSMGLLYVREQKLRLTCPHQVLLSIVIEVSDILGPTQNRSSTSIDGCREAASD